MTYEEALKILNYTPVTISASSETTGEQYHQMLHIAEKAIEKQIPKKPINPCSRYFGKEKGGNCPCCGAHTNSLTNNYCRKCGQKLDWSDTE